MRKGWIIAIGAAFALFALAYGASPYVAVRGFVAAAKQGDAEKLRGSVDFPAVRADLKPQLAAAVTTRMERDPAMQGNPLAGLGKILMPSILDRMIDSVVTPEGIAALVRAGKVGHADTESVAPRRVDYGFHYVTLNRFDVTLRRRRAVGDPVNLVFERRGLFAWKLVRIALPQSSLTGPADAAPA
ncbi:DUF2939 domain-containing protein [Sphingomonas asaccharolytica]|uniref:DUF2939 domain-containing protein n=1 Tax=Sphingomonas asaccharolytica TaxID=40681 RepID=UPI0008311E37|nr:DUF2939 domain-containing protein [Sphingomonas asaccharolytica]